MPNDHITYTAPAKINLSLQILGRRDDGFHDLETLVLPIKSLLDHLHFQPAETFSLHCGVSGVPTDESNLISRALRLFEQKTGISCPWTITLDKSIPHGAGLGGGSSDAASTLLALNELHQANIPLDELSAWAAEIGSDLPLFLYQSPCWCRGRGEIIEPTSLNFPYDIILFKPSFAIPTPWAYQHWRDSQELPGIHYQAQSLGDISLINDLERPVFAKHLFLAELKRFLLDQPGVLAALMSGSGSTVFAVVEPSADHTAIIEQTKTHCDPTLWTHHSPHSP